MASRASSGNSRYCSIAQAKKYIARLEQSAERMPELIGYRSADVTRYYRRLMVQSYSLAIVFIQYDLLKDALDVLKIAAKADIKLYSQGDLLDRLWSGRLITYTTLGFLFIRSNDLSKALKFIFDAQSLLFSASKSGAVTSPDLNLLTNLVTFLALWRIKRFKEAGTYVSMCRSAISEALASRTSKLETVEKQTLHALVVVSSAALELKAKGNVMLAERIVTDLLQEQGEKLAPMKLTDNTPGKNHISESAVWAKSIERRSSLPETPVVQLLKGFLKKIPYNSSNGSSVDAFSDSVKASKGLMAPNYNLSRVEISENGKYHSPDELLDEEFERLMFVAGFSHFINPSTPIIRESVLESARSKQNDAENYRQFLRRPKVKTPDLDVQAEPRSKSVHTRKISGRNMLPRYPKSRSSKRNSNITDSQTKMNLTDDDQVFPIIKTDLRETARFSTKKVMYMSPNVLTNQLNTSYRLTNTTASASKRRRPASTAMKQSRRSPDSNTAFMVEFNPDSDEVHIQAEGFKVKRKANTSHGARRRKSTSRSSSRDII